MGFAGGVGDGVEDELGVELVESDQVAEVDRGAVCERGRDGEHGDFGPRAGQGAGADVADELVPVDDRERFVGAGEVGLGGEVDEAEEVGSAQPSGVPGEQVDRGFLGGESGDAAPQRGGEFGGVGDLHGVPPWCGWLLALVVGPARFAGAARAQRRVLGAPSPERSFVPQ
ncbi:hypothetical protein ACFQ0O_41975 [Saccharopolyspora spinosporotrichia]